MKNILLPFCFKVVGIALTFAGIVCSYLRFGLGIKPAILEVKVFAVCSAIFKTSYFSMAYNNISEEICAILLLSGLFAITFSKEKHEREEFVVLRHESLMLALFINTILLVLTILLVFGTGFIAVMVVNVFSVLLIYNLIFRYKLFRFSQSSKGS